MSMYDLGKFTDSQGGTCYIIFEESSIHDVLDYCVEAVGFEETLEILQSFKPEKKIVREAETCTNCCHFDNGNYCCLHGILTDFSNVCDDHDR